MDTKRYIPINPKYVETIDINSLIEQQPIGVNLNEQPISSYYTTASLPVRQVEQPIVQQQPITEQPVSTDYTTVREPVVEQPKRKRRTNKKKQENSEPSEPVIPDIPTVLGELPPFPDNKEKDMQVDEDTIYPDLTKLN